MCIRKANYSDVKNLIEFNKAIAIETERKKLRESVLKKGIMRILKDPSLGFYLVSEKSNKTIGSLMVTKEWSDWRNGQFWWIQSVYVVKQFRKQGVYKSMYKHVKKIAHSNPDLCGFRLYVEKNNSLAKKVYDSLGMKETSYLIFEENLRNN